ncbi:MAG: type I pullulanase, partial [Muribaculaceae bacterium]|nr:type I pullulanase [Muribaculaceae bacterium]
MKHRIISACIGALAATAAWAAQEARYDSFPTYDGDDLELKVDASGTHFTLWSPEAQAARVLLYDTDRNSAPFDTLDMARGERGTWRASVPRQLYGKYYTFRILHDGAWLDETPGVWAKAVGTNGKRAAIIDLATTNPEGWDSDRGPVLDRITDAVIYEMHHRDMSMHPASGIVHKGKFLALTEQGTRSPQGEATGIDHLKELGVTHVHILPSYDYNSVDEANLPANTYNWGYDPQNYNAPEGGYSTDPANPAARISEMKRMIKALHDAGIGVVMDVVYNHTAENEGSNFSLTAPGYYYRHNPDGSYSDAS